VEEFDFELYKKARKAKQMNDELTRELAEKLGEKNVPEITFEEIYILLKIAQSMKTAQSLDSALLDSKTRDVDLKSKENDEALDSEN